MKIGQHPNIIWIVADALRADHTTMEGYSRETTPQMHEIAESSRGQYFSNCFSHSISTRPSVSSMLTGVYPSAHGVKMTKNAIPDEVQTVPEMLSDAGYHSTAISRNSHVSRGTGLDRGFDQFDWFGSVRSLLKTVDPDILLKYLIGIRKHSVGFSTNLVDHSIAYVVNEVAKRNIRRVEQKQEPFFMFLHYLGPHDPYVPPIPYRDQYLDEFDGKPEDAVRRIKAIFDDRWEYNTGKKELSASDVELLESMYDAEIAHTDAAIGELFEFVRSRSLERETVFVITADHGELLGERGVVGHELYLDDELVKVPLVVHGPDMNPADSEELVQHIDVVRTLVTQITGTVAQLQGKDLRSESREHIVAERCQTLNLDDLREFNPAFNESSVHQSGMIALRNQKFKYIKSDNKKQLYKLPDERTDVAGEYTETAECLDHQLTEWEQEFGQRIGSTRESELDGDMRQQLSDLGYLIE